MKRSGLPRLFVALYDYDPVTQSPNEDAADVSISLFTTSFISHGGDPYKPQSSLPRDWICFRQISETSIFYWFRC